jgi:hypothetical protein
LNNQIIYFGGGANFSNDVIIFHYDTNLVQETVEASLSLRKAFNTSILAAESSAASSKLSISLSRPAMKRRAAIPPRRSSVTSVIIGRYMVIFGGFNRIQQELGDFWVLDLAMKGRPGMLGHRRYVNSSMQASSLLAGYQYPSAAIESFMNQILEENIYEVYNRNTTYNRSSSTAANASANTAGNTIEDIIDDEEDGETYFSRRRGRGRGGGGENDNMTFPSLTLDRIFELMLSRGLDFIPAIQLLQGMGESLYINADDDQEEDDDDDEYEDDEVDDNEEEEEDEDEVPALEEMETDDQEDHQINITGTGSSTSYSTSQKREKYDEIPDALEDAEDYDNEKL